MSEEENLSLDSQRSIILLTKSIIDGVDISSMGRRGWGVISKLHKNQKCAKEPTKLKFGTQMSIMS